MKLVEFAKEQCEIFPEDSYMGMFLRETIKTLEGKEVVERDKINKSIDEIENLFEESFREAPCSETEFRCGLTRAIEIIEKNTGGD